MSGLRWVGRGQDAGGMMTKTEIALVVAIGVACFIAGALTAVIAL